MRLNCVAVVELVNSLVLSRAWAGLPASPSVTPRFIKSFWQPVRLDTTPRPPPIGWAGRRPGSDWSGCFLYRGPVSPPSGQKTDRTGAASAPVGQGHLLVYTGGILTHDC